MHVHPRCENPGPARHLAHDARRANHRQKGDRIQRALAFKRHKASELVVPGQLLGKKSKIAQLLQWLTRFDKLAKTDSQRSRLAELERISGSSNVQVPGC